MTTTATTATARETAALASFTADARYADTDAHRDALRAAGVPFYRVGDLITVARCFARHSDRLLGLESRVS